MNEDLLTLLDRVDPVDRERLRATPTPEDELDAILASTVPVGPSGPSPRRRLVRRAVPIAAGAVAIVVAAALLPGGDGDGASPEAAQALEAAAATAAADVVPAGAGEYAYSRVRQVHLATTADGPPYSFYMPTTIESWIASDGSGRVRETRHSAEWPGPRDEVRWRESGDQLGWSEGTTDRRYGPGELDGPPHEGELPSVSDLPSDPGALARVFEEEAGESSASVPLNAKMFEYGTSVLLQAAATSKVRSATYDVLAGIEGVELEGEARDPLGRPGIEVSISADYAGDVSERYSLIYDGETAYPLAYTERLAEPQPYVDSRLTGYTLLEKTGYSESAEERP
jgi:hypothetical protein